MNDYTEEQWKELQAAYHSQLRVAKTRKDRFGNPIEWQLTFAQWLDIWERSGKLAQRGKGANLYVMARKGDVGPYAVDNVEIITGSENCRFARTHDSDETKRLRVEASRLTREAKATAAKSAEVAQTS